MPNDEAPRVTLNIRVPRVDRERLREIAKAESRDMTKQILHWIRTYIDRSKAA